MVAVWAPIKYYKQLKYITMDAFFNALKAKFQKGGETKKFPTGAKIDTTGEKRKEAQKKGRGMTTTKAPSDPKKPDAGKYTPPKDIKPATKEQKARIMQTAKKVGKVKGKESKMYGGSMKKKRMYGGSKKKMY